MTTLTDALTGISGILVTPYAADGEIAPDRQKPIIDRAVAAGVHILVANGNTGEYYALTSEEAETMVAESAAQIDGRVPLVAGVGRGIRDACRLARASAKAGAAALMVHQPPDPFVSPRGLVDYLRAIRDAGDGLPLVLYLRNDTMGTDAIRSICEIDGVVGVKWATPNPMKLKEAIAATNPSIVWVDGLAEIWAPPLYAVGARGFTSGLINVWPERSVEIHAALAGGDYDTARRLIDEIAIFEKLRAEEMSGTNVTIVKAALKAMGEDCGATRPPSAWPPTEAQQRAVEAFLDTHRLR
ncbi:dihydrodipicolinate synthase family protein [Devosia pacifica]|uniref:Dihydrodipicolinate synthase family protein n=1 Tax=Devosia pacifica TaxID=1335967 RepID=A0A918RXJ3_9HYPH|nr:dihydrodipicolinate synthase family protein [Devosia pacifica]GHA16283.1 dihydrodipicolinate synthase family protein [Devosia pacifica]